MSQALKEMFVDLETMPVEHARAAFDTLAATDPYLPLLAKGEDIGRVVTTGLLEFGKRPADPPIFSLADQHILEGFLSEFAVESLSCLERSVPVILSGCGVTLQRVNHFRDLSIRERSFIDPMSLPAIRVHFVPAEY